MKNFCLIGSKKQIGFTLMELVVTVGVFGIIFAMAIGIFIHTSRIQNENRKLQKVLTESQFVMELVESYIRERSVNYALAGGGGGTYTSPDDELHIDALVGSSTATFRENAATAQVEFLQTQTSAQENLFSSDVRVLAFEVFVDPPTDTPGVLPVVTVLLETQSIDQNADRVLRLQSSVSSRTMQ